MLSPDISSEEPYNTLPPDSEAQLFWLFPSNFSYIVLPVLKVIEIRIERYDELEEMAQNDVSDELRILLEKIVEEREIQGIPLQKVFVTDDFSEFQLLNVL